MCAIIGLTQVKNQKALVGKALEKIQYRGKDNQSILTKGNITFGHALHAVVSFLRQPLSGQGIFIGNTEIYNWKEVARNYQLKPKNDADLVFQLLESNIPIKAITNHLDGVYAFAYHRDNKITLARDLIGVKPLWYTKQPFAFASEKKALEEMGVKEIEELNPRTILQYNTTNKKITNLKRPFYSHLPEHQPRKLSIQAATKILLENAVNKRIPNKKFGLLFSGGLDSSTLALLLKKSKKNFPCYVAVFDDKNIKPPEDLVYAKKIAKKLKLNLKVIKIKLKDVEAQLKIIVPLIEDSNVVKVGVALTFFKAAQQARKDGCKVLFSGLGAEELFAGYQRHKNALNINKECVSGLLKMYERDLYRDDVISMFNSIELRLPFLDRSLADYSLKIPPRFKLNTSREKVILRDIARELGLPKVIAERKKKAAQYGSRMHKALQKLTKQNNHIKISSYLDTFAPNTNPPLGVLLSTGKDSMYALYTMRQQNYPIKCLITIESENPDSYMFHTPTIKLAQLQAKALNLPLIRVKTTGKKEQELKDLKKALAKAKQKYQIEGIVSGALYSTYQRDRIEKIADNVQLKIFSPLWHINQETYMQDLINANFEIIITQIAADGLDESWLGKKIDNNTLTQLKALHQKNQLHLTGEGGEYETLVLNAPVFKSKIHIKVRKEMESLNRGKLVITESFLKN